jgi:hypothetical protein
LARNSLSYYLIIRLNKCRIKNLWVFRYLLVDSAGINGRIVVGKNLRFVRILVAIRFVGMKVAGEGSNP